MPGFAISTILPVELGFVESVFLVSYIYCFGTTKNYIYSIKR